MAAALYRKRTYDFAKAIYVVGNEQSAHFKQLKAVLKEMGYDWSDDMTHVAFGLVTKNGKKLSTRKGNVILLEPTIAEAVNRAQAQIEAKNPNLPNKEAVAHAVGVGAIKFYDLKTDRMNGYDFDLDAGSRDVTAPGITLCGRLYTELDDSYLCSGYSFDKTDI